MCQPRRRRSSATPCQSANLYCAQCNSPIGVFENEWEHLTKSYANPKKRYSQPNTRVTKKTQTVPSGRARKAAEGCVMADVVCKGCAYVVGQYCKSAPSPDKKHLVGQRFYKLSRVYLKVPQSIQNTEFAFMDNDATRHPSGSSSTRSTVPQTRQGRAHAAPEQPMVQPSSLAHSANTAQIGARQHTPSPVSPGLSDTPPTTGCRTPPEQYCLTPSSDTSKLSQEPYDQAVSICECMNRPACTECRINNEAIRATYVESCLSRCEEGSEAPRSDLAEQRASGIRASKRPRRQVDTRRDTIDEQQEQTKVLSEKLELVQRTLAELKALIHVNESPAVESSSPTWSRDFLKNLEIVVRTMRNGSGSDSEAESLCPENRSKKAHLELLARSIGAKCRGIDVSDLSGGSQCDVEEPRVSKKRKRNPFPASARSTKIFGQANHRFADPEEPPRNPLTPESTQDDASCSTDPHGEDETSTDPGKDQDADLNATSREVDDTDVIVINDDNVEPPEITLEASDGNEASKGLPGARGVPRTRGNTFQEAAAFNERPAIQTYRARRDAAPTGPTQNTQPIRIPESDRRLNPSSSRPNFSFNTQRPVPSFFNSHSYPAIDASSVTGRTPPVEHHARQAGPAGPFSSAIMSGKKLAEVIQKSNKAPSMPDSTAKSPQGRPVAHSKQSDPRQPRINRSPEVRKDDMADTHIINFDNGDNAASLAQVPVEDARGPSKSTLISRTIRGLTLEPLTRPVIENPPPRAAPKKDACQRPTVMPEFMAAIQNLDRSAARFARNTAGS